MKEYYLKIKLKSDVLLGSGEGYGAIINTDIVFDEFGVPFIPAKRIKGCLRHSANEIAHMFNLAKISCSINSNQIFGETGQEQSTPMYFTNLLLEQYAENQPWFNYFINNYGSVVTKEAIISTFTHLRQQTAIAEDSGTAEMHSLRTIRFLKAKGSPTIENLTFIGKVIVVNEAIAEILALACLNLRNIGTKRNRGFGEVECKMFDVITQNEFSIISKLEALCRE